MVTYPHLAKAPITEAVLDIRVEARPEFGAHDLDAFAAQVVDAFPDASPIHTRQFEISAADLEMKTPAAVTAVGKIFWTKAKDQAVQARVNGFSFNIVQRYESWSVHVAQARRLWTRYLSVAQPLKVRRCALRYINRIEIPVGREISDFVRIYPQLPDEISRTIDEYLMRIVVPLGEGRRCVITQALPAADETQIGGLVLDLDVFRDVAFRPDSDDVWNEFEQLHELKNRCFFESMQPAALETYK